MEKTSALWMIVFCVVLPCLSIGCSSADGNHDGGADAADGADLTDDSDGTNGVDEKDVADGIDDRADEGDLDQKKEGKITVRASGITGHSSDGFLVLIAVSPVGEPTAVLGSICSMITSDPYSLASGTLIQGLEPRDANPCQPTGGDKLFEPGDYDVFFSVIKGGDQLPEKSALVKATVTGDITVTAPGYSDWRGLDPSLKPGTITVNATGITGHKNDGYVLVIMATLPNQSYAALGSSCQAITSDPFSLPANTIIIQGLEEADINPCAPTGGDKLFGGGDYDLIFAVIKGGQQTPETSVVVPSVVDGNVTVSAPDYRLWK